MTDLNTLQQTLSDGEDDALNLTQMSGLLFFAYRDFISEPDDTLTAFGYGRAHHRVLYFVGRNPGMTVAELLEILRITKQSLARVLKQLVEDGYVAQEPGRTDRRQRLLSLTKNGAMLERRLAAPQHQRFKKALAELTPEQQDAFREALIRMIDPEDRDAALRGGLPISD